MNALKKYSGTNTPLRIRGCGALLLALFALCFDAIAVGESALIPIFPDTQTSVKYEGKRKDITEQFDWILDNQVASNVVFVGHVGDIVNDYDTNTNQWEFMQSEYARLASAGMPYALSPGNHDYALRQRDSTMMNQYFPSSSFQSMSTFEGSYDSSQSDNSYHLVSINGLDWLILSLEFGPRDDVLGWANEVVTTHRDNPVILITHAYLSKSGTRFVDGETHAASYGYGLADVNDGTDIWDKLVNTNDNVRLIICGHDGDVDTGARKLISTNSSGHSVCQMLTNYQYFGHPTYSSYMLLVEFHPEGDVSLRTYSPTLDQTYDNSESRGELDLTGFMSDSEGIQIKATWGGNGTITPLSKTNFIIQADLYYHVESVQVDGVNLGPITNYTWLSEEVGGTIHAAFSENVATNNTPEWWLAQYGWTNNFDEAALADPDGDDLANWREYAAGTLPDNSDSDGDLLSDGTEVVNGLNPLTIDSDDDGIQDKAEMDNGLNPLVSNVGMDSDGDGILDEAEVDNGLNPLVSNAGIDSDGDGILDEAEVDNGLDPLVSNAGIDSDGDGVEDQQEVDAGTDPLYDDTIPVVVVGKSALITVLPDTLNYVNWKRSGVAGQFNWILDNQVASNIVFVGHVGNMVHGYDANTNQWEFIQSEYERLDNAGMPYAVTPGDHDYKRGTRDSTVMNQYFAPSSFQAMSTFRGSYDSSQSENSYHIVNINGLDWLILSLEFGPRNGVLDWANEVMAVHRDNPVMLITHAYLSKAGTRFVHSETYAASNGYGLTDVNDGCDIWDKLVNTNDNIRLVIGGHDGAETIGARKLVSTNSNGHAVCQMLTNYQAFKPAYSGYMLLIEFNPAGDVTLRTYSPILDQTYDNAESRGELDLTGFVADSGEEDCQLTVTFGAHGFISPSGMLILPAPASTNFMIQADQYYHVESILVDGVNVGATTNYAWSSDEAEGTLHVNFSDNLAINGTPEKWLAQLGWTNYFDEAELADADGDGLVNWREYVANTFPEEFDSDGDLLSDGAEVDNGLDPLVSNAGVDSDGDELEDKLEVDAGMDPLHNDTVLINAVASNRAVFGLYSEDEAVARELAARAEVIHHPASYGLYTTNSIMDLNMGTMMLQASNGVMHMSLQIEQCTDLVDGAWTNAGDAVLWEADLPVEKSFYRIRAQ